MVLVGCADAPTPVVQAGDVVFTADQVPGLTDDRLHFLGELAVFATALADSALHELARPWTRSQMVDLQWQRLQAQRALDSAGVGDDVLRARYATRPELELTVRHLLVFSARYEAEATRAAARARAEAALARIEAGEPFGQVAAQVSEEPGAESREGLLTPGREGSWVTEFWTAATHLEPGGISDVVETRYGFHILRLEARDTVPFEEVRDGVALAVARLMGLRPGEVPLPPLPLDLPAAPSPAELLDPARPDSVLLAEGEGWQVRLGDVRDAAALLPYPTWATLRDDEALAHEVWERAVRRAIAASMAERAGVTIHDSDRASAEQEFAQRAEQWALQLGLPGGRSAEAIGRAALGALSVSGQNASLARDELRAAWGGLLNRFLPIRVAQRSAGAEMQEGP